MCVRVRARVWCSVVCGQWVAWRAHWFLNRVEQDQQVRACAFLFVAWVSRRGGAALFQVFQQSENAFDLGVEMSFVSLGKMNARDVW